ncbi:hypothetical protein RVN83_23220 [Streptomyces sp. PU10]|nr:MULTISPECIES: hypothetical protein [Streptomyces]MDU0255975.1 hypothetical protein [Streptomyces sp. PU10]WSU01575.1 hypothetical protein OG368_13605 [Streptomyces sp. NBC_01124]
MKNGMNTQATQLGVQSDTCNKAIQPTIQPTSPMTFMTMCKTHAHLVE